MVQRNTFPIDDVISAAENRLSEMYAQSTRMVNGKSMPAVLALPHDCENFRQYLAYFEGEDAILSGIAGKHLFTKCPNGSCGDFYTVTRGQ